MIAPAPLVVLHRPQLGENIGMAARAMGNCGLSTLRLSAPRADWDRDKAKATSAGASDIVDRLEVLDDLPAALADCRYVFATTARRRDMPLRVISAEEAAQDIHASLGQAALLFGAESSGLDNAAISQADAVIEVSLNPECTSLNLSQAVLLVAYAWWQRKDEVILQSEEILPASREDTAYFLTRLQTALDEKGFFTDENLRPVMWRNIQAMVHRSKFRSQEIQTWHGILSSLLRR